MNFIQPTWPAPKNIKSCCTQRAHGNLATHVNDDPAVVARNRQLLSQQLNLPSEPIWLEQIHSNIVVPADKNFLGYQADASFSIEPNQVCAILTADCLPILLCNQAGKKIAAIHAGWRGLANEIIENTLNKFDESPENILAWIGPGISGKVYEVNDELRTIFLTKNKLFKDCFIRNNKNNWLADLPAIAKNIFNAHGIENIYGGEHCTFSEPEKFFSYRRDGSNTGRQASLIWLE